MTLANFHHSHSHHSPAEGKGLGLVRTVERLVERAERRLGVRGAVLRLLGVEEELWELAAGEQVRALGLSQSDHYVTKNEFCLAMLVRMEKISEEDLRSCQAAFAKLDATETGRLDQHDLREHKRRGAARRASADASGDAA